MRDFTGWAYADGSRRVIVSPDGRESRSIVDDEVAEWIFEGGRPKAAPAPPEPGYREKRKAAYIAELGADPGFENTVGDVLDAVIKAIYGDASELDAMKAAIDGIKSRFPKPQA